jgi:heme-degrading monooxygenase HmoA
MRSTIILTRKIISNNHISEKLTNYLQSLHNVAKKYPGFIKGTSYWKDSNQCITISHWKSSNHWDDWLKNEERLKIINKSEYEWLILDEEHHELTEIVKTNNIFLL